MTDLCEPFPIMDTFCSGLATVENVGGGCLRFYLYVNQTSPITGVAERVMVAKIIAPASAVPDAVFKMVAAIGAKVGQMVSGTEEVRH